MPSLKLFYRRHFATRLVALFALLLALALPHCASAQCSRSAPLGFQNVSPEPGNPLQAEYSVRITPASASAPPPAGSSLRSVSRDSQGRLRIEHSRGKYTIVNPDGSQTTTDRISVFICDPSTGTYVHLDSLKKTATIHPAADVPSPDAAATRPFCARFFEFRTSDAKASNLGRQQIAGVAAQGMRFWSALQPSALDSPSSFSYTDTWCSDELAAVVSLVVVSANGDHRRETTLQKFSRKEPDPALFQIPAGYTRVQPETPSAPRPHSSHLGDGTH